MTESGAAIARFDFDRGAARGTHLTLYASCVVHRGDARLETIPLTGLASVQVNFQRDIRGMAWGIFLVVLAILVFLVASPLADTASAAAAEIAPSSGVAAGLVALLRFVEAAARALPAFGVLALLGGAALAVLGWRGETTLRLTFAGGDRAYMVRGRNAALLDFAEAVANKLMQIKRG